MSIRDSCNVALDSVVSDIFGKSSTSIIDYLLEQADNSINHEEIASKLLRSLKSKEDAVIESIEGYQMTDSQKYRMRLVRAHMDLSLIHIFARYRCRCDSRTIIKSYFGSPGLF